MFGVKFKMQNTMYHVISFLESNNKKNIQIDIPEFSFFLPFEKLENLGEKKSVIIWEVEWKKMDEGGFYLFLCFYTILKINLFTLRDREEARVREGADRERERIPSRLQAISTEPNGRLEPRNCEIMTQAEIKSQMLNWLSHPGALRRFLFLVL